MNVIFAGLFYLSAWTVSGYAEAQAARTPKEQIPQEMLLDVKELELRFATALNEECPASQCHYRGCVYQSHEVVTLKSSQTLPGLAMGRTLADQNDLPQFFLKQARCEYAYEPALSQAGIADLDKRLTAKLSKGMLKVQISPVAMPALPDDLRPQVPPAQGLVQRFMAEHFATIAYILLASLLVLVLIWALRRLGKDSLEAQLRYLKFKKELEQPDSTVEASTDLTLTENDLTKRTDNLIQYFSREQAKLQAITTRWLELEQFDKLGLSSHLFAKSGVDLLPHDAGHLQKRIKLQRFLHNEFVFEDSRYLKLLEELEASLGQVGCLYDQRSETFHRFYNHCHPRGITKLVQTVHPGVAVALYILAPPEVQKQLVPYFGSDLVKTLASRLLASPYLAQSELDLAERAIHDVTQGQEPGLLVPTNQFDYGTPMDVTMPLSLLLAGLPREARLSLLVDARHRNANQIPSWLQGVFYNEMLARLNDDQLKALFLECDAKSLAGWYHDDSDKKIKSRVLEVLPESYSKAMTNPLYRDMAQTHDATELGKALSKLCARGDIGFESVL